MRLEIKWLIKSCARFFKTTIMSKCRRADNEAETITFSIPEDNSLLPSSLTTIPTLHLQLQQSYLHLRLYQSKCLMFLNGPLGLIGSQLPMFCFLLWLNQLLQFFYLLFPTHFPHILFACSYLMLIISCLHSYFLLQTFFSFMCSLTVYA